ncbi:MAG: carboxylating nicotinate-nucleotide diphosphorylase [Clostridiales bacterium]|nr:carboxylating nicotinate-nucleotide diphosphorylase [Clostridiales bacterium]
MLDKENNYYNPVNYMMNYFIIDKIIIAALEEDMPMGDITTDNIIPPSSRSVARLIAKADGVIAGLDVAARVFILLDPEIAFNQLIKDGNKVKKGDVICEIEGSTAAMLKAERTALNLLQHMSGIATATASFCSRIREDSDSGFEASTLADNELFPTTKTSTKAYSSKASGTEGIGTKVFGTEEAGKKATDIEALDTKASGTDIEIQTKKPKKIVRITDTRKTAPGLRYLDKYAVRMGGGSNHRFNLSDGVLIKDNHIAAAGGIKPAVERVRRNIPHTVRIEVETENLIQVQEALEAEVDIIMLDNMSLQMMKEAVCLINGRALSEASGNVSLENVKEIASTGVDIISIGSLTHSISAFDISMKFFPSESH